MYGGSGNDGLDGGLGDDYLVGGPDNDHLIGGRGDDWLLGGDGQDILLGALGSDRLEGGAGNDRLLGDPQDASLLPGAGTNIVNPNYASILGLAIDPANNPNSTSDDAVRALLETTALTDKVTIFHDFVTDDLLDNKLTTLQFLHDQGIKTFVQLSVQFLGEPNPPGGLPKTFADPQVRQAYLDLVQEFAEVQPHRINLGAEINFLEFFRPAEFANFASLYQEAYYLVKSISPSTQVGVSMHLAAFRGLEQINILDTLGPRDYVGFTSYPIWLVDEGLLNLPTEIPASYHTWLRDQLPNEIIVLSELAWPHSSGTDEQGQRDFVARLPEMMSGLQPAEIYWPIAHDVSFFGRGLLTPEALDFLNQYNVDIDELFDRLNNMGLRHVQGMPYASWFEAMTLDFGNHNPGLTLPVGQNGRGDTLQEPKRLVEPTLVPTLPPIITSVGSDALDFATSAKEKESPTSDRNAAQLSIMMIGPTTDWRRDLTNIKFNFKANQYGHESLLAWLVDWQSTHGLGDLPEST